MYISTTADGKKYLYDIGPIKMVERPGNSGTTTTKDSINPKGAVVKSKLSAEDKIEEPALNQAELDAAAEEERERQEQNEANTITEVNRKNQEDGFTLTENHRATMEQQAEARVAKTKSTAELERLVSGTMERIESTAAKWDTASDRAKTGFLEQQVKLEVYERALEARKAEQEEALNQKDIDAAAEERIAKVKEEAAENASKLDLQGLRKERRRIAKELWEMKERSAAPTPEEWQKYRELDAAAEVYKKAAGEAGGVNKYKISSK